MEPGIAQPEELVERRLALGSVARELHAEERRARDVGQAVGAAGHRVPVEQDDPDDFAKAEGHDRQVIAAQAQHRKAEQDAERRRQSAGQRQALPEAEIEPPREQRVGVRADGVEGDVAEIQQTGEADHDVQAPAEHDVDQHGGRDVDHVAVGERQERQHEREHHAGRHQEAGVGPEQRRDPGDRCRGGCNGLGPHRAQADQKQASGGDQSDPGQDPAEAEVETDPALDLDRLHADQRQEQDQRDECRESGFLERCRPVDPARDGRSIGQDAAGHVLRPSRSLACPRGRSAGRSGPGSRARTRRRPCTRW